MRAVPFILSAASLLLSPGARADERVSIRVEYHHGDLVVHFNLGTVYGQEAKLASPNDADKSWTLAVVPRPADKGALGISATVTEDGEKLLGGDVITTPGEPVTIRARSADGDSAELRMVAVPESWGRPTKILAFRCQSIDARTGAAAADKYLAEKERRDPRVRVQLNAETNTVIVTALPEDLSAVKAQLESLEAKP